MIEPVAGMRRELRERRADQGAGQHVARVVHAGVDARIADQRRERAQRDGGRRRHVADAGRERERAGGVPGGERARDRHPHVARERHVAREPVGTPPPSERLDRQVDHGRGDRERGEPHARRPGGRPPAGEREQRRGGQREARVVGGARQPAHRAIERRRRRAGDRGVDREIDALGVLEPAQPAPRSGRVVDVAAQEGAIL